MQSLLYSHSDLMILAAQLQTKNLIQSFKLTQAKTRSEIEIVCEICSLCRLVFMRDKDGLYSLWVERSKFYHEQSLHKQEEAGLKVIALK